MPARSGSRYRFEATGCPIHPGRSRPLAEDQMPQPGGICRRRLDRTRRQPTLHRRIAARVLRSEREADLCRPDRYRDAGRSARRPAEAAAAAADHEDALDVAPPRSTRFSSPLVLSRLHWVRPEMVVEVKYLTWTDNGLLRQVVYEGIREDKPAREVVRR
jgi:bifunctional non-homologous end joining protein LigD